MCEDCDLELTRLIKAGKRRFNVSELDKVKGSGKVYNWDSFELKPFPASGPRPRKRPERPQSPLSLAPLTSEEWDHMGGKARWDAIVALRGPDLVNSGVLKWFTTSVIRHRLSAVMRVGGMVNTQLPCVVLAHGGFGLPSKASFDLEHFRNHIHEAADWLKIPIVWTPEDIWAMMFSRGVHQNDIITKLRDVSTGDYRTMFESFVGVCQSPVEMEASHESESL